MIPYCPAQVLVGLTTKRNRRSPCHVLLGQTDLQYPKEPKWGSAHQIRPSTRQPLATARWNGNPRSGLYKGPVAPVGFPLAPKYPRRSSHQTPQRRHSTSQRQPWRSARTRGYPRGGRVLRRRRECLPHPALPRSRIRSRCSSLRRALMGFL
jgi:hypothetical protein